MDNPSERIEESVPEVQEWRKLIDLDGNWVGMERTQFMTVEAAVALGYKITS